ncbi:MAG: ferritin [Bacteroidota bacterium]
MKDLMRQRTSIKPEIVDILNEQVRIEATASAAYLAMAAWCDQHGWDNSADHFYTQADEERMHMLKLFRYVSDMGAAALSPKVGEVQHDFSSLRDVFETALDNEIHVTESINKIVAACRNANDFATESFMQWYVQEQVEEEYVARRALELFDIMGDSGMDLILIDERIPKIVYQEAGGEGEAEA